MHLMERFPDSRVVESWHVPFRNCKSAMERLYFILFHFWFTRNRKTEGSNEGKGNLCGSGDTFDGNKPAKA